MKAKRFNILFMLTALFVFSCNSDDENPGQSNRLIHQPEEGFYLANAVSNRSGDIYFVTNDLQSSRFKLIKSDGSGDDELLAQGSGRINDLILSRSEDKLYYLLNTATSSSGGVRLYQMDLTDNNRPSSLTFIDDAGSAYRLRELNDGTLIFSASNITRGAPGRIFKYDFTLGLSTVKERGQYLDLVDLNEESGLMLMEDSFDRIIISDLSGNNEVQLAGDTLQIVAVSFTPDGNGILGRQIFNPEFNNPAPIYSGTILYDLNSGTKTRLSDLEENIIPISYDPSGTKLIAYADPGEGFGYEAELVLWDLQTGEKTTLTSNTTIEVFLGFYRGESNRILYNRYNEQENGLYLLEF